MARIKTFNSSKAYVNKTNEFTKPQRFGYSTDEDYAEFEQDGTLVFHGASTTYNDINISGASLVPGGSEAPSMIDFAGNSNLKVYAFNGSTLTERIYGSVELQHDYKEGSDIELHIHWTPTTANSGNVLWQVYYSWCSSDSVFPAGTLLNNVLSPALGAWRNTYVSMGVISGTGKTLNSHLIVQIFRVPTATGDDYPDNAALIQFGIHYNIDSVGSRTPLSK